MVSFEWPLKTGFTVNWFYSGDELTNTLYTEMDLNFFIIIYLPSIMFGLSELQFVGFRCELLDGDAVILVFSDG